MRLGTAIERLFDNYVYASDKEWINDKVAWALYQTWKEADIRKADAPQTDWVEDGVPSKYCDTCDYDRLNGKSLACDGCEMVNGRPTSYKPITDCGWGEPK